MCKITTPVTRKNTIKNTHNLRTKKKQKKNIVKITKTKPIKKASKPISRAAEKKDRKIVKTSKATAKRKEIAAKKKEAALAKTKAKTKKQALSLKTVEMKKAKASVSKKTLSSVKPASKSLKKTQQEKMITTISANKVKKFAVEQKKKKNVEEAVKSFKEKKEKQQAAESKQAEQSPMKRNIGIKRNPTEHITFPLSKSKKQKRQVDKKQKKEPKKIEKNVSKKKYNKLMATIINPPQITQEKQARRIAKYIQMRLDKEPIIPDIPHSSQDHQPPTKTAKKSTKAVLNKSQIQQNLLNFSLPLPPANLAAIQQETTIKTEEAIATTPKQPRFKTISELERIQRSRKERIFLIEAERKQSEWRFKVMGSQGKPYTTVVGGKVHCNCVDFRFTKRPCKHIYFIITQVAQADQLLEFLEGSTELADDTYNALDEQLVKRLKARMEEGEKEVILNDDTSCVICFCEMETQERLSDCPCCKKYFHTQCLGMWKKHNNSCPLCRTAFPHEEDPLQQLAEVIL